jgi:hypothetical protein
MNNRGLSYNNATLYNSSWLLITFFFLIVATLPVLVAARFKARVCGRSLAGSAGSNPAEVHG